MTFKELFQTGQCTISVIDDWVALWNEGKYFQKSLQDFLGLSAEEYQVWLLRGNAGLADLLNTGHSSEYTVVHWDWDELTRRIQGAVNTLLGPGYTVSLRRQDYYYWGLHLETAREMTEELSSRICKRLDLRDADENIFMDTSWIDNGYLLGLLSMLTHREATSSHADDHGVYIICKSLLWSSQEYKEKLLKDCEKRLRREIDNKRYPTVNPDTACHQLFGFMEALKVLGLLDADQWRVAPDYFGAPPEAVGADDTSDSAVDQEGICPVCGADIEYGGFELLDEGGVYEWSCPQCGATGKEGYDLTFDGHHYDVRDSDGKEFTRQNTSDTQEAENGG